MHQKQNIALAGLILPEITKTGADFERLYPNRNLNDGAEVTRFAPSPTGYLHVGGLYASLVSSRLAKQTGGVYYLRIEDTDKKREIEHGVSDLLVSLERFGITFDEGVNLQGNDFGQYGPYKQSLRKEIYQTFAKELVEKGLAYPCFCSEETLSHIRKQQETANERPGYYGKSAVCRHLSLEQIEKYLGEGKPFVLRLRSFGDWNKTFIFKDGIKGNIEMPENDQDIVLLKSDGMPTYHFAHVVDDHLMRTTTVTRGDEWLSSASIHMQLFESMGWEAPKYAHFSTIQKEENGAKRKLSKRKDPEATVAYYHEHGIPAVSLTEYLLNLANSNYEDWRRENPNQPNHEFQVTLEKMSVSGSLFDMLKLLNISKNVIGEMSAEFVYQEALIWAKAYDGELYRLMYEHREYTIRALTIDRGGAKPRKDIAKWSDVRAYLAYFYDILFEQDRSENGFAFGDKLHREEIKTLLNQYLESYDPKDEKELWFDKLKAVAEKFGFSKDVKAYKKNPDAFRGHVGDVAELIRIALTNRKNTPDLYEIMQVMGPTRVNERLHQV